MSALTIDVGHTAKLAKLDLSTEERARLHKDMQQILTYVSKLDELDLDGVPKTLHPIELPSFMREDVVEQSPMENRDERLALAPEPSGTGFGVPKVIE